MTWSSNSKWGRPRSGCYAKILEERINHKLASSGEQQIFDNLSDHLTIKPSLEHSSMISDAQTALILALSVSEYDNSLAWSNW